MKVFTVMNQKGGVGKTTSAINIAAALAMAGQRVLIIDLDPQANLTRGLGLNGEGAAIMAVLAGEESLAGAVRRRTLASRNGQASEAGHGGGEEAVLDVVPATARLAGADMQLAKEIGKERLLAIALAKLEGAGASGEARRYDVCLIDCPATLGLLPLNALASADYVLIPVQFEPWALDGINELKKTVGQVHDKLNPSLRLGAAFGTLYDQRRRAHKDLREEVEDYFGDAFLDTIIRIDTKFSEAPSHGQTIFEYAPKTRGSQDYRSLAQELIDRYGQE